MYLPPDTDSDSIVVYEHVTLVMPGVVTPGQSDEEVRMRLETYAEEKVEREFKPRWKNVQVKHGSVKYVPIVPPDETLAKDPNVGPDKIALLTSFVYWEP